MFRREPSEVDAELAYMVAAIDTNKDDFGSLDGELRIELGLLIEGSETKGTPAHEALRLRAGSPSTAMVRPRERRESSHVQ
jgi:hypothetical protein